MRWFHESCYDGIKTSSKWWQKNLRFVRARFVKPSDELIIKLGTNFAKSSHTHEKCGTKTKHVAMIFGQCSYLGPWQTHLVLDWSFVFQQVVVRCYFYANEVWLLLSKRSAFVSVFFSKWGQSLYDIKFLPIWRHLIVSISTLFWWSLIQVNLFLKCSFLHQLTHNMTTDCSLIYDFSTKKYKFRTCCVQTLFWMPKQKQKSKLSVTIKIWSHY